MSKQYYAKLQGVSRKTPKEALVGHLISYDTIMNDKFYAKDVIQDSVYGWNGSPFVLNHPKNKDGQQVMIRSNARYVKDIAFGVIDNARLEDNGLVADIHLDKDKFKKAGKERLYKALNKGKSFPISVGAKVDTLNSELGVPVVTNINADHVALVPLGSAAGKDKTFCVKNEPVFNNIEEKSLYTDKLNALIQALLSAGINPHTATYDNNTGDVNYLDGLGDMVQARTTYDELSKAVKVELPTVKFYIIEKGNVVGKEIKDKDDKQESMMLGSDKLGGVSQTSGIQQVSSLLSNNSFNSKEKNTMSEKISVEKKLLAKLIQKVNKLENTLSEFKTSQEAFNSVATKTRLDEAEVMTLRDLAKVSINDRQAIEEEYIKLNPTANKESVKSTPRDILESVVGRSKNAKTTSNSEASVVASTGESIPVKQEKKVEDKVVESLDDLKFNEEAE